jgi:hypothetical protein
VAFFLLALGWLVITAAFGVLVESLLRRRDRAARRPPNHIVPKCGSCGYIVAGLPGHRCPECGANLRHVGIVW